MATLRSNLAGVRRLLGFPDPHEPDDVILFEMLSNQVQHHHNQLQNGQGHWSVDKFDLSIGGSDEDTLVAAANMGKPFWVYTADPTNPSHVRREVPFVLLNNIGQFYAGPEQLETGGLHSVQYITFYRRAGAWFAKPTPIPSDPENYVAWFETGLAPTSLGDEAGLSPFNHLIRTQAALGALPHCAWTGAKFNGTDREAAAWERKTSALALSLGQDEKKFQKEFSTYLGTLMNAGVEAREGYGEEYDSYWRY